MSAQEFRTEIVDHYWPNLGEKLEKSPFKCTDKKSLPDDYAQIGAFLTNKPAVEKALEALEQEIRRSPVFTAARLPDSYASLQTYTVPAKDPGGSKAHLKSHKLLTNALRKFEAEMGFNHEKIANGQFHDEAIKDASGKLHSTAAFSGTDGKLASVGKEKTTDSLSKAVTLPRGAPTVLGDLDPLAFNVLLRHGYQFKDVAAGAYHGEYTHRLQWFALVAAALPLRNPPLEIFRSLGWLFAKADTHVPNDDSAQLWMWQALFDTAETAVDAKRLRTLAYTTKGSIFTCPEAMNKSLMSLNAGDAFDTNPLWCLRLLLKTRWKKRFDETGAVKEVGLDKLLNQQLPGGRTRAVLSSDSKTQTLPTGNRVKKFRPVQKKVYDETTRTFVLKDVNESYYEDETAKVTSSVGTLRDAGYALVWYLRNDTVQ